MYKKKNLSPKKYDETVQRLKDFGSSKLTRNKTYIINNEEHVLFGMAVSLNYIVKHVNTGLFYLVDLETILTGGNIINNTKTDSMQDLTPVNVKPIKMKNLDFDPSIFQPMLTNTPIDNMFSTRGGIFPATNYMIVGDPGIGKSTLTLDILANVQSIDTSKKVLFISGEMTRIDMYDYVKRYPKFGEIDTIFLGEYLDQNPKMIIESIFNEGYDLILTDSFVEVQESVKESCRMTSKGAEKWLIDLMVINNQGQNKAKKHTSFLMIQQVTKGGNFVGSNKLKHNTTGMMEIRYSNEFSGDRYIKFTKNRRGCEYDKLYFSLDLQDDVEFDNDRLQRDIDIKKSLANEKNQLLKEEDIFEKLFTQDEHQMAEQKK